MPTTTLRALLVAALAVLAAACGESASAEPRGAGTGPPGESPASCKGCHRKLNPGLIADLEASPHERAPVTCEECHGSDHEAIFAAKGEVPPTVCGRCHEKAWEAFQRSRHGRHLMDGKPDPTLRTHYFAVGSCTLTTGCHSIQKRYPDGSVGRCGACHPTHSFSNHEARNPRTCYTCHCGADNSEYQAWLTSAHSLSSPTGRAHIADCVACHDPHDVSLGCTHGLSPVTRDEPPAGVPVVPLEEFEKQRGAMLERCRACHGTRFAREALKLADTWRRRGAVLVQDARRIVEGLHADGLLSPGPAERAPNPVAGTELRLGFNQIYDLVSTRAERIWYDMRFHDYPALWRGAYHTDPERFVWEWNDRLKSSLDELRAIERALRGKEDRR